MNTRMSGAGKSVGRAAVAVTIFTGFYDIGAQMACAAICGDIYPGVNKDHCVR